MLLLLLISGCSGGNDFSDLREYIKDVAAEPKGPIQKLPEFKPYEAFKYSAANLRSPFQAPLVVQTRASDPPSSTVQPPPDHVRGYLEEFNLVSLQLVGSIELRGAYYGLIRDAEGTVHQIGVGDYLGTQWGRIESVEETQLRLVEIVSNGGGGWLLRPRTIELFKESEG